MFMLHHLVFAPVSGLHPPTHPPWPPRACLRCLSRLQDIRNLFKVYDTDGSGELDEHEFVEVLCVAGEQWQEGWAKDTREGRACYMRTTTTSHHCPCA